MSKCKTCDSSDKHVRRLIPDLVPCWDDEFHGKPEDTKVVTSDDRIPSAMDG